MLKTFGKLWLRGAKRLAKAHVTQQKKLQKTLVTTALAAVPKPKVTRKRAPASKAAAPARKISRGSGTAASKRAPATRVLPGVGGSWSSFYHSDPSAGTSSRRMTCWLYVPETAVQKALPLVVMLHGCEQTAPDFASGTRMNQLAARHGFAVLYPQQSAAAHSHRCWPWYKPAVQQGGGEVALVAGAIEKVIARHGFDRSRVYAAGLSAGAGLAQLLALRHPHLIAAVASHSGPAYGVADSRMSAFSVMQQGSRDAARPIGVLLKSDPAFPDMPLFILQGDQDNVVRPINALQLSRQFCQLNRLNPVAHEPIALRAARGSCDAYRTTDYRKGSKVLVRVCEVAHLAHAWSGGDASLRYNAAQGPDASKLLWDFFKRHRRS